MNTVTIAAILASVAFAIAIGAVVRGRAQDHPDWGLAVFREDRGHLDDALVEGCDCEDCTEDPMDAYLEERAAGNGVLPFRPHTECVNRWADGEPHRVHSRCRAAIEAGGAAVSGFNLDDGVVA